MDVGAVKAPTIWRDAKSCKRIATIGLDITAKSVFQVHGVDNDGKVVIRRQLKRRYVLAFFEKLQPCLVGIEACPAFVSPLVTRTAGVSGHTVRLMLAGLRSAPYVKRQKNDVADAEANSARRSQEPICGLCQSRRPSNKAGLMLHRTRHLFIRRRQ